MQNNKGFMQPKARPRKLSSWEQFFQWIAARLKKFKPNKLEQPNEEKTTVETTAPADEKKKLSVSQRIALRKGIVTQNTVKKEKTVVATEKTKTFSTQEIRAAFQKLEKTQARRIPDKQPKNKKSGGKPQGNTSIISKLDSKTERIIREGIQQGFSSNSVTRSRIPLKKTQKIKTKKFSTSTQQVKDKQEKMKSDDTRSRITLTEQEKMRLKQLGKHSKPAETVTSAENEVGGKTEDLPTEERNVRKLKQLYKKQGYVE